MTENKLLSKSFLWMAIGMLVTFGTGYVVSNNEVMLENVFGGTYWIWIVLELVLVIFLSARIFKMNATTAKICFILYSFVSGLTFSSVFVVYNISSVIFVFLLSSVVFGIMAFIGMTTKLDLTKVGFYFLIGILACFLAMLFNLFINSSTIAMIITIICIILFIGITAYDVQKIKQLENSGLPEDNLAIYGALQLYLDFINIFLDLLRIFGNSDRN